MINEDEIKKALMIISKAMAERKTLHLESKIIVNDKHLLNILVELKEV